MQVLCFINALFVRVIVLHDPVVHRTMGRGKKIFKLVWRCHQLLSGFLTKGHLPPVSRQFYLSASDRCDNEMIPGVVRRFPGTCLKTATEEEPERKQTKVVSSCVCLV